MAASIHPRTHRFPDGREIQRLGYGAMQITGEGVWGDPADLENARAVLRAVVAAGVDLIDTADSYGPDVSERLIGETLAPYDENVLVATKAGLVRPGPGDWQPNGRPAHIKEACDGSLQRLKVERIPLYQLHRIDPDVPVEDSIGAMLELREAGKIQHIGLSEVGVEDLRRVQALTPVAAVQNHYHVGHRVWDPVLDVCTAEGIAFLPWYPLGSGDLGAAGDAVAALAAAHEATPQAVALAWLLRRSPVMLPIPGTKSLAHLQSNLGAADLLDRVPEEDWASVDAAG